MPRREIRSRSTLVNSIKRIEKNDLKDVSSTKIILKFKLLSFRSKIEVGKINPVIISTFYYTFCPIELRLGFTQKIKIILHCSIYFDLGSGFQFVVSKKFRTYDSKIFLHFNLQLIIFNFRCRCDTSLYANLKENTTTIIDPRDERQRIVSHYCPDE